MSEPFRETLRDLPSRPSRHVPRGVVARAFAGSMLVQVGCCLLGAGGPMTLLLLAADRPLQPPIAAPAGILAGGVLLLVVALLQARRARRLLAHGVRVLPRVVRRRLHPGLGLGAFSSLDLDYTDHHERVHRLVVQTREASELLRLDRHEVFYDPDRPANAVVPAVLPGAPRLGAREVEATQGWRIRWFLAPGLAVAAHVLAGLVVLA